MENQINTETKTLLPVLELFKKSFDVYQKKVWTLAGLMLFFPLGVLISGIFSAVIFSMGIVLKGHSISLSQILIAVLLGLICLFFVILLCLWARVALFCAIKEQGAGIKKSLILAWEKIGSFFWVSLLTGLVSIAGYILFIIPGIIFSVWFGFSVYIFIWEGLKGTSALKRSKQLVQGYWWPIFGIVIVLGIVVMLISWIKFFGPIINLFFMIPFSVVFMFVLYEDLKRIKS